jgi:hypothetical protein
VPEKKLGFNFPPKGTDDNKPTPRELYNILIRDLHYNDVCLDPKKFNALLQPWPNHSYCNPPFSIKERFIARAIFHNVEGKEVLMYLPFDPGAGWFQMLYRRNPLIIFFLFYNKNGRYPHMLINLASYPSPRVVFVRSYYEVKKLLPSM